MDKINNSISTMASEDDLKGLSKALSISEEELSNVLLPSNINTRHEEWQDSEGNTLSLLECALWKELWKYVPFVLKHGAEVNIEKENDRAINAPLYLAMGGFDWDTVELLVKHGASLTATSYFYEVPAISYCLIYELPKLEIMKQLMPPKRNDSSEELCRAIVYLLVNTLDGISPYRLDLLKYLLQNLTSVNLESITFYSTGTLWINENMIHITELEKVPRSIPLFVEMLCHFLQETCMSTELFIDDFDENSISLNVDTVEDQLYGLSDNLTRHPPSLFKLSTLAVKQSMAGYEDSDFDSLELPVQVVSRLKWEELAIDLYRMWERFIVVWCGNDLDWTGLNLL